MANISEEIQSEDKESKSDMETDLDDRIEQAGVATTSVWDLSEQTEKMSTEEFIAFMVNLDASSQKVLLNVNFIF